VVVVVVVVVVVMVVVQGRCRKFGSLVFQSW
jgi:hypothetical protein